MDKNAIKKYAIWARRELIARVSQRALYYGISEKDIGDPDAESVNGRLLSETERKQRSTLIIRMKNKGYEQVIEEVAYTWFNRFAALRFMEVNGYLPSHVRVFTNDDGEFKPQILTEAIHLELDGLDMEKVYDLKQANKTEELYKYLLIVQCNALSPILPGMFQKIEDYTELLLPDNLLREGSVIEQMVSMIPENDWTDQVQIIGWLYQYYNTEPKDKVFENLKKNIKITKENIPAATQLFTPDWIVRYMVENSLGRLWLEGHPNDNLKAGWKYYLDEAEQEPEVQKQLAEIRKEYAALKPEDIKCIDPCMGSGHILCYMFDVLVKIYEDYGYTAREAVAGIIEKNLWGLDIDERAAQLAYFAVMMKARQYDARFFKRKLQPHIHGFRERNGMNADYLELLGELKPAAVKLMDNFRDAMEYGSIINIKLTKDELSALRERYDEIALNVYNNIFDSIRQVGLITEFRPLLELAEALAQKYDAVITNPPYMGASGMGAKLSEFVKKYYPDSKSDLFAVFIERCRDMIKPNGYQAMITQHAWMFLSSFEKLRAKLNTVNTVNMAHLGARAFEEIGGEVVQTTSFVMRKTHIPNYKGTYCRLIEPTTQQGKEDMFLAGENRYTASQDNFDKIPGAPVAYWASEAMYKTFDNKTISDIEPPRFGMSTSDNNRFVRIWHEVSVKKFALPAYSLNTVDKQRKWYPYNNGGEFRRWYGDNGDVVNWEKDGLEIKAFGRAAIRNKDFYYKAGITWTAISSSKISVRAFEYGFLFSSAGFCIFEDTLKLYLLAFMNSIVGADILRILSPTINFNVGDIARLPIKVDKEYKSQIEKITACCIDTSRFDWDSFETSWDFKRHPLIAPIQAFAFPSPVNYSVENCYEVWKAECDARFNQLKANEEELNRIFIEIYGLQDELTPEVEDKDITVRKADLGRDIRSLISYAVGCMFGRYSLDVEGLAYAGGEWDISKYSTFIPDADNVLPITDDEYFTDDIVTRFMKFIEVVYGKETLEENLKFIASALGGKGSSREVIRNYFLNDFYADHLKVYQKRPIYWLFDSGKKNGFKALIYMHRYQPDTIARIRTDYVHEQQSRYRTAIADLENRIASASTAERVKLTKQLSKLTDQAEELRIYEEKIHHLADQMIRIDLDDGVKVNYAKFQDVLAKIK